MNKRVFLPMIALAIGVGACAPKVSEGDPERGIALSNLDTTAVPGNDFYQYATGGWQKLNPITDEYSRYGIFEYLGKLNDDRIKELIEEIASAQNEEGTPGQKIADLFNIAMDTAKLNEDGYMPIKDQLAKIASIDSREILNGIMAELMHNGVMPFFGFYVNADPQNSSMNIMNINQGGLSLANRDYYLDQDDKSKEIRAKYRDMIIRMFELCDVPAAQAGRNADHIIAIETSLAESHYDNVKLRRPYENYHMVTISQLSEQIPAINWSGLFKELNISIDSLNLGQPEPLKRASELIAGESLDALKAYMSWCVIDNAAKYLSDDFRNASFEFYGKTLTGVQVMQPRWKYAQGTVNSCLGNAVGQLYVEKYFPAAAKERMIKLVENLQLAFKERIMNLEWMSSETKQRAIEKLDAFYVKIGYPDEWKDYSALKIAKDSYYANIVRASRFAMDDMLADVNMPVDKSEWLMDPQIVNAYYNPTTNEICFPAAILQYPFFSLEADDAFNYGAIGVVIGHEMTHGFDDQGKEFDKDGNLNNWWSEEDAAQFTKRAAVMSDYFDKFEVLPGVFANGKFTLGETIADYGGLQISLQAYKNARADNPEPDYAGYTPIQRFFIANAGVWACNIRDEEILRRTKTDPHALAELRVNGEFPHIDEWYEAFGVDSTNTMYLPKEQRVSVW